MPPVEYHGTYFDFPLRNVLPKPLQKPHPPLWVACSQRDTIEAAGQWGIGALGFQFVSADEANAWVHAYYNGFTKRLNKLADYATNPNLAVVCGFMCCPTDEEANVKADGWTFFAFALRYYSTTRPVGAGAVNLWDEYQKFRRSPQGERMHAGGLIGSPETIRTKLRKFERSHVDQVILLNQAGRKQHPDICSSLELFAAEVMPEFVGRDDEHQAWKRQVLARRGPARRGGHVAATRSLARHASRSPPAPSRPRGGLTMTDAIRIEDEGAVRRLVLCRPDEFNTITPQLRDELDAALDAADRDAAVKVVLLSAEGRAFCAGFGLDWSTSVPAPAATGRRTGCGTRVADVQMIGRFGKTFAKLHTIRSPPSPPSRAGASPAAPT